LSIVALVDESQQNGHGVLTSAIAPTVRKLFDRLRPPPIAPGARPEAQRPPRNFTKTGFFSQKPSAPLKKNI